jgi:hypothetical protein
VLHDPGPIDDVRAVRAGLSDGSCWISFFLLLFCGFRWSAFQRSQSEAQGYPMLLSLFSNRKSRSQLVMSVWSLAYILNRLRLAESFSTIHHPPPFRIFGISTILLNVQRSWVPDYSRWTYRPEPHEECQCLRLMRKIDGTRRQCHWNPSKISVYTVLFGSNDPPRGSEACYGAKAVSAPP